MIDLATVTTFVLAHPYVLLPALAYAERWLARWPVFQTLVRELGGAVAIKRAAVELAQAVITHWGTPAAEPLTDAEHAALAKVLSPAELATLKGAAK